MTSPVRTVPAETPAKEAATLMLEEGINSVVVDDTEGVVSMVTTTDLTAYLAGTVDSESTRA